MLEPGFSVRSPRGTVVEILDNRPERFALRRHLPSGTGRTAPHRHLEDAVERFTLLEGEATGMVAGEKRHLRAGDVLEVPRGATHVHPHTSRDTTAVVEHVIEPRLPFGEGYFPAWLNRLAEGKVDRQEELRLLDILAVLDAAGGDTWIAGPPIPVQRVAARLGSRLARFRG
jgi:mannose-6-phosphate isomerase-like protein (cupin superfamily)